MFAKPAYRAAQTEGPVGIENVVAAFFANIGDKLQHQHSGIISVMPVGCGGKMRPNSQPIPKLEDQTDELVASGGERRKMARASIVARG